MIAHLAQAIVVISGLWLLFVAGLMLLRPTVAREALRSRASTPAIHFGEPSSPG